ncbi:hypothetical protein FIBSPDRAFT_873977 [Athelia psychrophila]|uniref:Uncharacterized protein n=1 Tax=Athelia psychrophila TaxID=1759441 RepID=A0A165XYC1_9AGAM|nr:hypothetical protein FIBSPDRAFT_873977 [Fibularhizoctonia sp. CBS 109695]
MTRFNTSNTRGGRINNTGRDQHNLGIRDVIIHNTHHHYHSDCQSRLGPVAEATERSSVGAHDRASTEPRATVEVSEAGRGRTSTGSLTRKLWSRVCRVLRFR